MPSTSYSETKTEVRPGDRVKLKRWWRYVNGTVVHVPGISKPRKDFDAGDIQEVAIKTDDGLLYGVIIEPETNNVRDTVKFCSRGGQPDPLPDVIDDPYIEND